MEAMMDDDPDNAEQLHAWGFQLAIIKVQDIRILFIPLKDIFVMPRGAHTDAYEDTDEMPNNDQFQRIRKHLSNIYATLRGRGFTELCSVNPFSSNRFALFVVQYPLKLFSQSTILCLVTGSCRCLCAFTYTYH